MPRRHRTDCFFQYDVDFSYYHEVTDGILHAPGLTMEDRKAMLRANNVQMLTHVMTDAGVSQSVRSRCLKTIENLQSQGLLVKAHITGRQVRFD